MPEIEVRVWIKRWWVWGVGIVVSRSTRRRWLQRRVRRRWRWLVFLQESYRPTFRERSLRRECWMLWRIIFLERWWKAPLVPVRITSWRKRWRSWRMRWSSSDKPCQRGCLLTSLWRIRPLCVWRGCQRVLRPDGKSGRALGTIEKSWRTKHLSKRWRHQNHQRSEKTFLFMPVTKNLIKIL